MTALYTPSAYLCPSASKPRHVISAKAPSPLSPPTRLPAALRSVTLHLAFFVRDRLSIVWSSTPSPFGLKRAGVALDSAMIGACGRPDASSLTVASRG